MTGTPAQAAREAFYSAAGNIDDLWEAAAQAAIAAHTEADLPPWEEILLLKQVRDDFRALAAEILGEFSTVSGGWYPAGVTPERVAEWRKRAGLEQP